jgi:hypothetical protein
MAKKNSKACQHCGACDKCDYCEHCHKCKRCGRLKPFELAPIYNQPITIPSPNSTPYFPPTWPVITCSHHADDGIGPAPTVTGGPRNFGALSVTTH